MPLGWHYASSEDTSVGVGKHHLQKARAKGTCTNRLRYNQERALENLACLLEDTGILQEARYVIESVICDPNFEGLVLGCIEADFCK